MIPHGPGSLTALGGRSASASRSTPTRPPALATSPPSGWARTSGWSSRRDDRAEEVAERLRTALQEEFAAVTDVSAGSGVIRLTGPWVRDVLAAGCTLDLHPRAFQVGRCAQTILARAMVTIVQVDDAPTFDLFVRRSFADYLARWLEDAGRELGLVAARSRVR